MGARDSQDELKQTLQMTANTIGRDLLERLVLECRMLPDVWPKLTRQKQEDVIGRLRTSVESAVTMAVHLIASNNRTAVTATLDKLATGKNGIQASLLLSKTCPARYELLDAQGKEVLIIVADADDHMGDTDSVKGEDDQRAMDLGHEYDPNGDGKGMEGHFQPGEVVDAEFKEVPALPHSVLQSELDQAYRDGWVAADRGLPKDACPAMRHELVAQWTQAWTDFQEGTDPRVQIDAVPDAATPPGEAPLTPIDALQAAVDAENAQADAENAEDDAPQADSDAAAPAGVQDSAKPKLKPSAKTKPSSKKASKK